jgi:hypothetical protein
MGAGRRVEFSAHGSRVIFLWPEIDFGLIIYYWRPHLRNGGFPIKPVTPENLRHNLENLSKSGRL